MSTQLLLTQVTGSGGGAAGFLMLVPYLLIFVVFWFFLIRPQQMRAKEQRNKIAAVKPRDQVVTGDGDLGQLPGVADDTVADDHAAEVNVKALQVYITD